MALAFVEWTTNIILLLTLPFPIAFFYLYLAVSESIHATMNFRKLEAHVNTADSLNSKMENVDGICLEISSSHQIWLWSIALWTCDPTYVVLYTVVKSWWTKIHEFPSHSSFLLFPRSDERIFHISTRMSKWVRRGEQEQYTRSAYIHRHIKISCFWLRKTSKKKGIKNSNFQLQCLWVWIFFL